MKDILLLLASHYDALLLTGLAVVGFVLGSHANRKRQVAIATFHAFQIVEDLVAEVGVGKSSGLDKALQGLKAADEYMRANGWRPLKPGEQEVAKLNFRSMNAQADAAIAVVAGSMLPIKPTA